MPKWNSGLVKLLGLAGCGFFLWHFGEAFIFKSQAAFDLAMGAGNEALGFMGLVTLIISQCLKNMEDRLSQIENIQTPLQK